MHEVTDDESSGSFLAQRKQTSHQTKP